MAYSIEELLIVGEQYTININDVLIIPSPCDEPVYSAASTAGLSIISVIGSIVTYMPTNAGDILFGVAVVCGEDTVTSTVTGTAYTFQAIVSQPSEPYTFLPCCNDCFNPIIVSNLYEGDTYIPFSLDMEDGTAVTTQSNDIGKVLDGKGVIELSEPLIAGADIQLMVDSPSCKAVSSIVKVKSIPDDCESCANPNACHIRLLNVSVKSDGVNLVSINRLNVEAFGELRYRLDNGEWFSDWSNIGSFSSLVNHTLGIKLVNNPSCRIEYPFLAISYT